LEDEEYDSRFRYHQKNDHQTRSLSNRYRILPSSILFFSLSGGDEFSNSIHRKAIVVVLNMMATPQGLLLSMAFFYLNPFIIQKYQKLFIDLGIITNVSADDIESRVELESDYTGSEVDIVFESELSTARNSTDEVGCEGFLTIENPIVRNYQSNRNSQKGPNSVIIRPSNSFRNRINSNTNNNQHNNSIRSSVVSEISFCS
jgi:hypothetical protein